MTGSKRMFCFIKLFSRVVPVWACASKLTHDIK